MMDLLLKAQTNQEELAEDDPQVSYLISAWARVCKIMGKRFEPYLPLVMGPVLKTASIKPEVSLIHLNISLYLSKRNSLHCNKQIYKAKTCAFRIDFKVELKTALVSIGLKCQCHLEKMVLYNNF